jgi:guanylate kinase
MTDERLLARLRGRGNKDTIAAADRIEALTAEREWFEESWVYAADKLAKATEALRAVAQHEASIFFGPDAEKNRRASWRGVMRKVKAALAKIEGTDAP